MPVVRFVAYASTMLKNDELVVDEVLYRMQPTGEDRGMAWELELSCSRVGELVRARRVGETHVARRFGFDERSERAALELLRHLPCGEV